MSDDAGTMGEPPNLSPPYTVAGKKIELPWASMYSFKLYMYDKEELLATGSCMAVARNGRWFIVTNRHNVTGVHQDTRMCLNKYGRIPDRVTVMLPMPNLGSEWWALPIPLYDDEGEPIWVEHPSLGPKVDAVALPIERPPEAKFFGETLEDIDDFEIAVGDAVHTIGFRKGEAEFAFFAHWIPCTLEAPISSEWNNLPLILIKGDTQGGSSGSPVIAYREDAETLLRSNGIPIGSNWATRFVGLYSGRLPDGRGMVWRFDAIREIVDAASA